MAKKNADANTGSLLYYSGRIAQKISLLVAGLATFTLFSTLISSAVTFLYSSTNNELAENSIVPIDKFPNLISVLSIIAGVACIVALIVTITLAILPRVRRYDKKLIVDGIVTSLFLLLMTVFSETLVSRLFNMYL